MSAIAGIHSRDGSPLRRDVLARLGAGLRHRAPGEERCALSERVGMLHRTSDPDAAPRLLCGSDGWMASLDGWIDNGDEVARSLGARVPRPASAPELVLAAYREWGIAGFARLVGDFAAAVWDPGAERLVLACDSMGARPLYYHLASGAVCWASQCRPLHRALALPLELDEEYVADFIANRPPLGSPFRGIGVVPGGHALVVDRAGAGLEGYWSFDPGHQLHYRSDEEYEAHFAELFRTAVACRMRTSAPIFCELSGGLDSSSIACVADRLLREGRTETSGLHTVSYVFDHARSSDERRFIQPVEERLRRPRLHIAEEDGPILAPLPGGFLPDVPTTQLCFQARQNRLTEEMARTGSRVLLNGVGGDQLFLSEPPEALALADALSRGRVLEVLRSCGPWARQLRWPYLKTLWVGAVQPLLPQRWDSFSHLARTDDCWSPAFVKRTDLRRRTLAMRDDLGFPLPSSSLQYRMIRHTMRLYVLDWCASTGWVDVRYPYLDRRLVEFALAVPLEQKVRGRETRSLVRRSLRDVLPQEILRRRSKAGPTEAFHRAVNREWPWLSTLMADPRVCAYGFAEREALTSALSKARHGLAIVTVHMLHVLSLELWLRTLEQRAEGPAPCAAAAAGAC